MGHQLLEPPDCSGVVVDDLASTSLTDDHRTLAIIWQAEGANEYRDVSLGEAQGPSQIGLAQGVPGPDGVRRHDRLREIRALAFSRHRKGGWKRAIGPNEDRQVLD
ncbi:MAG TPA: hypothetical protein VND93_19575, partial [Myxococcales bacterium]|nr:hypothetical protein [Myxococcales bacterium]